MRTCAAVKKLFPLLLCFSLTVFTVARAPKPDHALAAVTKSAEKQSIQQNAKCFDTSETDEGEVAGDEDGGQDIVSDDYDNAKGASDEGPGMNGGVSGTGADAPRAGEVDRGDDDGGDDSGDDGGK
jgi:hypothetical protein